jgi:hypothetical protein
MIGEIYEVISTLDKYQSMNLHKLKATKLPE